METIVARHDALRARFSPTGETMTISPDTDFPCPMTDLSQGQASPEGVLTAYLQADASTPFDLVEGPPIRARLFKLSDASHALVLTAHHIICDGWSINVIITELAEIYASLRERRQPDLGPVLPFSEYARAQSVRAPQEQAANASYWAEQFAKPARPIDLPTDRPRPAMKSYAGATAGRRIEARALSRGEGGGREAGLLVVRDTARRFRGADGATGRGRGTRGRGSDRGTIAGRGSSARRPLREFPAHPRQLGRGRRRSRTICALSAGRCSTLMSTRTTRWARSCEKLAPAARGQPAAADGNPIQPRAADNRIEAAGLSIEVEPNAKAFVNFDIFWNVIEFRGRPAHRLRLQHRPVRQSDD